MKVGWIGAGQMGAQMALRAARGGHELTVFADAIDGEAALRDAGARVAGSAAEAVGEADVVCLCVFSDGQARAILLRADGGPTPALAALSPTAVLAIHTSGAGRLALDLASAAPTGARVIDAPFSGQQDHVRRGALTLLVGGEAAALEAARPVLRTYASTIVHVGALGAAQAVKLANQLLYQANLEAGQAALEALAAKGVDPATAVKAIAGCSGASWALAGLAQTPSMDERRRSFQRYLDLYLAAAAEDGLDLGRLQRMAAAARGD